MEISQHLVWLLGAVKASVSGSDMDEKKLNRNISDCLVRIKGSLSSENKEQNFDDFRAKFTLVMLLCCPTVRDLSVIGGCKDFQSIMYNFPQLQEFLFFSVIRNQKCYKFLSPILSLLPPAGLHKLIKEYFMCTNDVTPITLAITLELLKANLFTLQNTAKESKCTMETSDIMTPFLKFHALKMVSNGSSAQVKSSAYYFMYLCESTYMVLCGYSGRYIEHLNVYGSLKEWNHLLKPQVHDSAGKSSIVNLDILKSFMQMCQANVQAVTIDVWMEWNDITLPATITVHRKSAASQIKSQQSTIQSVVCNIAFDILKIFETQVGMKDVLATLDCEPLLEFLKQVASDPDYDPDVDLPLDQLLSEINLKDNRLEKLLGILLKKDDIMASNECIDCIMTHNAVLDNSTRLGLLVRLIKHLRDKKECDNRFLQIVVNMAEKLPSEQLVEILENHLTFGLDELLKTSDFNEQMTAVFNQLADSNSCKNCTKHIWLCLQSSRSVVQEAVRLPVAFPGLVSVMVQALAAIPQVCQAKGDSGVSLLATKLQERQLCGLHGREQQDFADLVKGLIKADVLDSLEVLHLLIEPSLKVCSDNQLQNLDLLLELLKSIIEHDEQAVIKSGPELVSLILMLMHIIHATAYLSNSTYSVNLKLRADSVLLLRCITQSIANEPGNYEKDISMLKQMTMKYTFHPRCLLLLRELLYCKEENLSIDNCFFSLVVGLSRQQVKGRLLQVNFACEFPSELMKASRQEWILMLFQLLPQCSEEEWTVAFYITHQYLKSGKMALHTMMIFQEVLYLVCTKVKKVPSIDDSEEPEGSSSSPVSVQHCFRCFANAAMVYLEELMQEVSYLGRFKSLCAIFRWWCRVIPMYQFCQELPSVFLMQLCISLEEMFKAGYLYLEESRTVMQVNRISKDNRVKRKGKAMKKQEKTTKYFERAVATMDENPVHVGGDEGRQKDKESNPHAGLVKEVSALQINDVKTVDVQNSESDISERSGRPVSSRGNSSSVDSGHKLSEDSCPSGGAIAGDNRTKFGMGISRVDFQNEIEQVAFIFVKYVPSSNLASSVAGKLKKLYEIL